MTRTFIFASALDPHTAGSAVADAETPPDLSVISPSSERLAGDLERALPVP